MPPIPRLIFTLLLLLCSNAFMTFAWYFHVKKLTWTLPVAILISWLIALPEYILQVPANRLGHIDHGGPLSLPQLKILQEAITLAVFTAFTIFIAKEKLRTNDIIAFALILAAVVVSMTGRQPSPTNTTTQSTDTPTHTH